MYQKKRVLVAIALMLALAMLVTGCGSPETDSIAPTENTANTESAKEFELNVASGADPISLDPRLTWVGSGYSINYHVMEPLVFRQIEGNKVNIYGVLAEKWEQRDNLTWVFYLRQGIKFHNGEPLTAKAVKFTMDSIMDPNFKTPLKTWLTDVEEVTTEGDYTVVIKTKYPTRGLLSSLAQVSIVEPKAVASMGSAYNTKPVGTGPYKVESYIPNNQVVLERFDEYWGKKGKAKKITFRIMPENSTRLAALQAGEVDIAESLPPDKVAEVESKEGLAVMSTPTLRVDFLTIQHDRPWLKELKFRQAISYAIDRQSIVDNILGGTTVVASSPSPPGTIGFNEELPPFEYNVEKAKQLLKEIGYNGEPITYGAPSGRYAMDRQINEAVAAMLQSAGINVQLEILDWSSFYPKKDSYDMYYIGQTDFTINPNKHYDSVYYSKTATTFYKNEQVDALLEEAIQTMDDAAAAEIYKKVQQLLVDDMASIPLHYEPSLIGVSKKLSGFKTRLDEYVVLTDAQLAP